MNELPDTDIIVLPGTIISFVLYILVVITIGALSSRFSSSGINNFFIGGRRMGRLIVAMSAVVSGRSAWLLLGFTGMAYTMGLSAVWAVAGYIIVEFFLFFYYARRLRRFTEKYDCITLPDFFTARFPDPGGRLRLLVVVIIIIFMVAYVSAQFVAGGKALAATFSMDYTTGLLLTAMIILVYVVLGGFLAVSLNDTIQAFIIIFALLAVPVKSIIDFGGWNEFITMLAAEDTGSFIDPFALSAGAMIGFLGIGLGSPGNPHIIARYMSIRNPRSLPSVAVIGTVANILMAGGALFVGLVGRLYFPDVTMLPGADTENLYPVLSRGHLHPFIFGLVIASIFAAIVSTADSQLLVAGSAVIRDIYEKWVMKGKTVTQKKLVFLSRSVITLLVITALLMSWAAGDIVFWLVLFAWAGLGAAFGPASILALYWRRTSRQGVIAGIITGAVTVIVWNQVSYLRDMIYELVPAFILAFIVTVIVSLGTRVPGDSGEMMDAMTKD
jgi:sodium/proline symporter